MAAKIDLDWKKYETVLTGCIVDEISAAMKEYPDESCALHGSSQHSGNGI